MMLPIRSYRPCLPCRKVFAISFTVAIILFTAPFCRKKPSETPPPVEFKDGAVHVRADSEFLSLVSTTTTKGVAGGSRALQSIGQIILLVIPSGSLIGSPVSAVHLDPALSASLGIDRYALPSGTAVGIVELPIAYREQIRNGASIRVAMYGLRKAEATARVRAIQPAHDGSYLTVIFLVSAAPEWYPGASCRVFFPGIRSEPAVIPARALVHSGKEDYVFVEEGPHSFRPRPVVVLEEKKTEMQVLGIRAGAVVVERGALLMKPYLAELEGSR